MGPKLVVLDNSARVKRVLKKLGKVLADNDATALTFIVERKSGTWNIQSTHFDTADTARILEAASKLIYN